METITARLDPFTAAIIGHVAASYHLTAEELVTQMLYRDAATMSGWPGNLGNDLRGMLAAMQYPDPTLTPDVEPPY